MRNFAANMRKSALAIVLFTLFANVLFAETMPMGYYDSIAGKQDSVLKSTLHEIIFGGERCKYGTRSPDSQHLYTWDAFPLTDIHADGTIWDMYSPYVHHFPIGDNVSAASMQIEHSFPKSWWGGAGGSQNDGDYWYAYCDLYHLTPAYARANNQKSNFPPGYVPNATKYENAIFKMGNMQGSYTGIVYEPCDEYKGDFARAYFYIATAYEHFAWQANGIMSNTSYLEFEPWLQQVLLEWHRLDPVSEKEVNRADAVSTLQHNRNPYIDYPELVEYIWGNKQGQVVQLTDLQQPTPTPNTPTIDPEPQPNTERRDTLLWLPMVKANILNAHEYCSWNGTTGTANGAAAMNLGTASKSYTITINYPDLPDSARLEVMASLTQYSETEAAHLLVKATTDENYQLSTVNYQLLADIPVTPNEVNYYIPLPQNTQSITLSQAEVGKRVTICRIAITTPYTSTAVNTPQQQVLDYTLNGNTLIIKHIDAGAVSLYNADGRLIARKTVSNGCAKFTLPAKGIYFVQHNNQTLQIDSLARIFY